MYVCMYVCMYVYIYIYIYTSGQETKTRCDSEKQTYEAGSRDRSMCIRQGRYNVYVYTRPMYITYTLYIYYTLVHIPYVHDTDMYEAGSREAGRRHKKGHSLNVRRFYLTLMLQSLILQKPFQMLEKLGDGICVILYYITLHSITNCMYHIIIYIYIYMYIYIYIRMYVYI